MQPTRSWTCGLLLFAVILIPAGLLSANMLPISDLIARAEEYDKQMVVVTGKVSDFQIATNRDGQLAYGFLLKETSATLKVIGLGKAEVREGEQVIVEGIFSRHRQVGRSIIYNEIKATTVRPIDRLNPDLVG